MNVTHFYVLGAPRIFSAHCLIGKARFDKSSNTFFTQNITCNGNYFVFFGNRTELLVIYQTANYQHHH